MAIYKSVSDLEGVKVFRAGDEVHFWCGEDEGWREECVSGGRTVMKSCSRDTCELILGCGHDEVDDQFAVAFPGRRFWGMWPDARTPESLVDTCRWLMRHAEVRWGKPPVEDKKRRPQVGDVIRVTCDLERNKLKCGDICKIIKDDNDHLIPFKLERTCDGYGGYHGWVWAKKSEVELVQSCGECTTATAPEGFEKTYAIAKSDPNIAAIMSEILPVISDTETGDLSCDFDETIEAFRGLCRS